MRHLTPRVSYTGSADRSHAATGRYSNPQIMEQPCDRARTSIRVPQLDNLREQHRRVGIGAQIADKGPIKATTNGTTIPGLTGVDPFRGGLL
jgi:hypothetical protein